MPSEPTTASLATAYPIMAPAVFKTPWSEAIWKKLQRSIAI
jgi:hypothetical protein